LSLAAILLVEIVASLSLWDVHTDYKERNVDGFQRDNVVVLSPSA